MSGEASGRRGPLPRLHVVTDDNVLARSRWPSQAAEVLQAGGGALCLHLRGPRTPGRTLCRLAEELAVHAERTGAYLFVNDRADLALVLGLQGVHLGGRSLPTGAVRGLLGPAVWLGRSVRGGDGAAVAREEGADYVFLGTIFETPTHPGVRAIGTEGVRDAVARLAGLPLLGIGGVDPVRAGDLMSVGAHGVAVVRGIWDAEDPGAAVPRYLSAMTNGRQVA